MNSSRLNPWLARPNAIRFARASLTTRTFIHALFATLFTLLVGCATHHPAARNEHPGWTCWETSAGGNGHWYKAVLVTHGISWTQADLRARAEGGYLATTTSAAENQFVFSLLASPEFFNVSGSGPLLGGFQRQGAPEPDGGWFWVTGEPWKFTRWYPGQPDNWPGGPPEDRLHFYCPRVPRQPTWNDIGHDDTYTTGYVIERDK
jgi:hypothetical protein